jgi:choline dehydrogenase-like flavoprotein
METIEYDVVVVGSGIAGAVVAKTLTDAGKKVLVLDAGLESGAALGGQEAYRTQMGYLQTFYNALVKAPNSAYPNLKSAPSADVHEVKPVDKRNWKSGYLVQKGPLPFASDNWVGPGGTTQHWLGTALRMLPNDFRTKMEYDHAVDWPISYADLNRYYEMAEYEIGVAGDVSDQHLPNMGEDYFRPGYVLPMQKIPQSYLDKKMLEQTDGLEVKMGRAIHTVRCCSTPQGRNSIPNPNYNIGGIRWDPGKQALDFVYTSPGSYEPVGSLWDRYTGQRCEGNASCVPICPVQAKYNALKTFKKAKEKNKELLEIKSQAVAYQILIDRKTNFVQGIKFKRYEKDQNGTYTTYVARGKIYVLAASAIENAKLLLVSDAANSSDEVGRNLMDHLCLLTWGLFPRPVFPFRGPGSTTNISSFRDGPFRKEHAPWICPLDNWGWGWPTFAPGTDVTDAVAEGKFGKKLKETLNDELTRQVLLHFECEQDPERRNRVTIDARFRDPLDNFRPVIRYDCSPYMLKAFKAAKQVSDQIFKKNKITDKTEYKPDEPDYVEYEGKGYTFRGAGHIVGTHRMGASSTGSVVNADMRTWDHKNLFLVGAGNMPTLGTSNPTLTLTALTFRAAEAILRQLEKPQPDELSPADQSKKA